MESQRLPKQGEIYRHFKDRLYQIITVAIHSETGEPMVVYQALYGDFKTYVRPLDMFISEVDRQKYPDINQKYRFELVRTQAGKEITSAEQDKLAVPLSNKVDTTTPQAGNPKLETEPTISYIQDGVNSILLKFLDAQSYSKKLDVITTNMKHLDDRLINDMAAALDCTVDEGPLDERIHGLIYCLQAMCRFEDRRLR
jgi:hypothetical protein